MREILFRGKSLNNNQWIYGYLYCDGKHYYINKPFEHMEQVNPETIGQYTGLTDKLNNKVFEGDILDFDEKEWGGKFENEFITMELITGDWELCGSKSDLKIWRKVIGNVTDHPHLLN